MNTKVETTCIAQAIELLKNGGLIAYPTEGVFGIGCDPQNEKALARVIDIKQRDAAKGLILVADQLERLAAFVQPFSAEERKRIEPTWPGPVTWVVRAKPAVSPLLTGGRNTLAVRISAHPVIQSLCSTFGGAIVSTSANLSGQPACLSAAQTKAQLGEKIDLIIDAATGEHQGASTIRDAATGKQLR